MVDVIRLWLYLTVLGLGFACFSRGKIDRTSGLITVGAATLLSGLVLVFPGEGGVPLPWDRQLLQWVVAFILYSLSSRFFMRSSWKLAAFRAAFFATWLLVVSRFW